MDTQRLLLNLSSVFENSNYKQSQTFLQQIIDIAKQKSIYLHNQKLNTIPKIQHKSLSKRKLIKKRSQKLRRKFISKIKLKQIAITKIQKQNKKLHQNFIKYTTKEKINTNILKTWSNNYTIYRQDKEQQKIGSSDEYNEHLAQDQSLQKCIYRIQEPKHIKHAIKKNNHKQIIHLKFKKTRKNFQNYLKSRSKQSKAQDITCPICIETLIEPVSTQCGHTFCFQCLDQSLLFGNNCPVCRLMIKGFQMIPCQYLSKIIKIKCDQFLDNQSLFSYRLRKEQNQKWKKDRFIDRSLIKKDYILDVRDTQHIWCKARVANIYHVNGKITSILVHYLQWAKIYDQIIDIKSCRLAPKDYFSQRKDISRYNLGQGQENMRGAVVQGNNQNNALFNNQLNFANIMQLDSLRNSINFFQNNWQNQLIQRPLNRANFLERASGVSFLRQNIGHDSENEDENEYQSIIGSEQELQNQDNDNDSSLGSFAFGQYNAHDQEEPQQLYQQNVLQQEEQLYDEQINSNQDEGQYIMIDDDSVGQIQQNQAEQQQDLIQSLIHNVRNNILQPYHYLNQRNDYEDDQRPFSQPSQNNQSVPQIMNGESNEEYEYEQNSVSQ